MTRACVGLLLCLMASAAAAQTVTGARLQLTSGPCTLRSGSGAPSSGLGAVCDTYFRTDSPYTVYVKTGASTWSEVYRQSGTDVAVADGGTGLSSYTTGQLLYASGATTIAGLSDVATGSVLVSGGTSTAPAYSATPSVTSLTATGTVQGATVIGTTKLQSPLIDTASGNLTLAPAGDIVLGGVGDDVLPDVGYTQNLGALTNKFLTLHAAELWVETLVAQNTIATIGGRILVGPTTMLTADLASGASTMTVKHNQIANGDRVVLQANGAVEWIRVSSAASGSGPYSYSIERNLDGSGANNWTAGDAVFNTGTTGDGFIDLYSVAGLLPGSTAGPTIVGNVRTGTTYSDVAPRWAIGNLNGLYGYGTDIYGSAFGDSAATNVTVDATNGFRIRSGTTDKFKADTSGNLSIVGDLSVGTAGVIRSGATAYGTGTGYWAAYNGGTPEFRVGNPSGNRLSWDGTNLTLVSQNATIDSTGIAIVPDTSFSTARSYRWTVPTGEVSLRSFDNGTTQRAIDVVSSWTGTGDLSTGTVVRLLSTHLPSSGGSNNSASVTLTASGATSDIQMLSTRLGVAGYLEFYLDATSMPAAGIGQTVSSGLTLRGISGSTYDLAIRDAANNPVIAIATGTSEILIAGVSSDGNGKVLCVKSDSTIGTCNASSIGSSTCTCS